MAGDWIPICDDIHQKTQVLQIAGETGRSINEVVGILVRLWAWAVREADPENGRVFVRSLSGLCPVVVPELSIMDIQRNVSVSLISVDDLHQGLNICLDACLQVTGMDCGGIYLFDSGTGELNLKAHKGFGESFVKDISTYGAETLNVQVVKRGKPIYALLRDLDLPLTRMQRGEGLRAFAMLPIFDKEAIIGCINLASHDRDEISTSSCIAVETIGALAGSVIGRLKAKQALQESEAHLKSLMLEAENYALYRLAGNRDDPGRLSVVFVSPSIVDIMGVDTPDNFESWFENIHQDDRERVVRANLEAFQTTRFNETMKIYHPGKKAHRWIHAISKGIVGPGGELKYINGIIIDITDSKRAENALMEKEKELAAKSEKLEKTNRALNALLQEKDGPSLNRKR